MVAALTTSTICPQTAPVHYETWSDIHTPPNQITPSLIIPNQITLTFSVTQHPCWLGRLTILSCLINSDASFHNKFQATIPIQMTNHFKRVKHLTLLTSIIIYIIHTSSTSLNQISSWLAHLVINKYSVVVLAYIAWVNVWNLAKWKYNDEYLKEHSESLLDTSGYLPVATATMLCTSFSSDEKGYTKGKKIPYP